MELRALQPTNTAINSRGVIAYSESVQAWNTIRLKKEIVNVFSSLKEKASKFVYNVTFYRTYDELEKAIKKIKKEKQPIPILLLFHKAT